MMPCKDLENPLKKKVSRLVLYYDNDGDCHDAPVNGDRVSGVLFETSDDVVIRFEPRLNAAPCTLRLKEECGEGNVDMLRQVYPVPHNDEIIAALFVTPPDRDLVWGWDFGTDDAPPPIKIKVRVRRG